MRGRRITWDFWRWTRSPSAPGFAWSGRRRSRWWAWASSRGQEVALAKPQTMMNLSGLAVRDLLARLECGRGDLIVLYDDVALPWGMLRIRERGTAGGHNGLKSVIGAVGTQEFARVRMGVQPEHPVGRSGGIRAAADAQGGAGNRRGRWRRRQRRRWS